MALPTAPKNKYIVGKCVAVLINGKPLFCSDGNVTRTAKMVECTNSESEGYAENEAGTKSGTISLTLMYNSAAPPDLFDAGDPCVIVVDTLGRATESGWIAGAVTPKGRFLALPARITSIPDQWSNADSYTWKIEAATNGKWTVNELSADAVTNATPPVVTEPTGS